MTSASEYVYATCIIRTTSVCQNRMRLKSSLCARWEILYTCNDAHTQGAGASIVQSIVDL